MATIGLLMVAIGLIMVIWSHNPNKENGMAAKRTLGPFEAERYDSQGRMVETVRITLERVNGFVYITLEGEKKDQRFIMSAAEWDDTKEL